MDSHKILFYPVLLLQKFVEFQNHWSWYIKYFLFFQASSARIFICIYFLLNLVLTSNVYLYFTDMGCHWFEFRNFSAFSTFWWNWVLYVHILNKEKKSLEIIFVEKNCTSLPLLAAILAKLKFQRVMASFEFQWTYKSLFILSCCFTNMDFSESFCFTNMSLHNVNHCLH